MRNMSILIQPEEEIPVVLPRDFDVASIHLEEWLGCARKGVDIEVGSR